MAGTDILHAATVSPQVLYSQQLPSAEAALFTVLTNQSARLFQGTVCNSTSSQSPPTLTLSATNAQSSAPVITLGTTGTSGGTFAAATYFWKVTATTTVGETSGSNEVTHAVAANGTQQLNWSIIGGANGYKVYRGTASGSENVLVATISGGSTVTYLDTGIAGTSATVPSTNTSGGGTFAAATYFWVLSAVSSAGETLGSAEVTGAVGANGSVVFTWTSVPAAVSYKLYRGTVTGGENALVATVTAPTTTVTDTGAAGSAASPVTSSTFATPVNVWLSLSKSGGALDSTHRVINNVTVAVDDTISLSEYLGGAMLGSGDFVSGYASVAGAVVLVLSGTVHT